MIKKNEVSMIQIEYLTKSYAGSDRKAIENISFTVQPGEIVGFIGPNGAGKSTTIKCLTGILPFESGEIYICGKSIQRQPIEAKKHITFIPDENNIYNGLTGLQYIRFIADVFGVSDDDREKRISEYAELFDMKEKLSDKISSYSHGMKQKIAVIAGLVHDPDVWVLDEPMTGLDPKAGFELKNLMRKHAEKGNAVLFSSHVLEVVEKLCTKVVIIDKGHIITECSVDDLQKIREDMTLEELFLKLTGALHPVEI